MSDAKRTAALAVLLTACGATEFTQELGGFEDAPTAPSPATGEGPPFVPGGPPDGSDLLRLGTGVARYEPPVQGDLLRWVRGRQGGHHLLGALRVAAEVLDGVDRQTLRATAARFEVHATPSNQRLAEGEVWGRFYPEGPAWETAGVLVILDPAIDPIQLDGQLVRFSAIMERSDAVPLRSAAWVQVQCCD